jgi:hypothetical protein
MWTAMGAAKTGVGSLSGYRGQMFYVPTAVNAATTVTLTISSAVVFRAFECAEYSYSGTISFDGTPQYSTTPASGGVATISGLTTSNSDQRSGRLARRMRYSRAFSCRVGPLRTQLFFINFQHAPGLRFLTKEPDARPFSTTERHAVLG